MPTADHATDETPGEDAPLVTVRTVSENRSVFTEEDNPDGWIATDLTVTLEE
jgi:hypothetical protein